MSKQIVLSHIIKDYDENTRALDDVSLSIEDGEWVSIIGPSGSGKTTLLNIMSLLDKPTEGKFYFNDVDIKSLNQNSIAKIRRENIGLIFQQYHLIPYLSALDNVMISQFFHSMTDRPSAEKVLERVGLAHRINYIPQKLSGGEQQRVCIARALINEPSILVADEPTGNLDIKNGENIMNLIKELHQEGHTIILVTHNLDIARMGQRIIKLIDGRIDSTDYT